MAKTIEIVPNLPRITFGHTLNALSHLCKNVHDIQEHEWFTAKEIRDSLYTKIVRPISSVHESCRYHERETQKPVADDFVSKYPEHKQTAHDPEWFWKPQVEQIERFLTERNQVHIPDFSDRQRDFTYLDDLVYRICDKLNRTEHRKEYWMTRWQYMSFEHKEKLLREHNAVLYDVKKESSTDSPQVRYRLTKLGFQFANQPSFWNIGPTMHYIYLKPIKVEMPE